MATPTHNRELANIPLSTCLQLFDSLLPCKQHLSVTVKTTGNINMRSAHNKLSF